MSTRMSTQLGKTTPDFPQPVATLKAGLVWAWPDVEKWAKATGRTVTNQ